MGHKMGYDPNAWSMTVTARTYEGPACLNWLHSISTRIKGCEVSVRSISAVITGIRNGKSGEMLEGEKTASPAQRHLRTEAQSLHTSWEVGEDV